MKRLFRGRRPSPAILVSIVAVILAGVGTAGAAGLITGSGIKDKSIKTRDLGLNSVTKNRLSQGVQDILNQRRVPGANGTNGTNGTNGSNGTNGTNGTSGLTGPTGAAGVDGLDAATNVTSLSASGPWSGEVAYDGAVPPGVLPAAPSVIATGAKLGPFTDGSQVARIRFNGLNGKTLADLADASYTSSYTQTGTDAKGGLPYFRVFTRKASDTGPTPDRHVVVFTANTQPDNGVSSGRSQTWDVIHGQNGNPSGVRYDDDPGESPDITWNDVVAAHGDDVITGIIVQAGDGGAYSTGSTALVQSVTLRALGFPLQRFDFGT